MTNTTFADDLCHPVTVSLEELVRDIDLALERLNGDSHKHYAQMKQLCRNKLDEWHFFLKDAERRILELPQNIQKRQKVRSFRKTLSLCEKKITGRLEEYGRTQTDHTLSLSTKISALGKIMQDLQNDIFSVSGSVRKLQQKLHTFIPTGNELAARHQLQWGRKFFHVINTMIGLWLYVFSGLSDTLVLGVLAFYFGTSIALEIARRRYPRLNEKMCRLFSGMMREHERTKFSSATMYLGAVFAIMLVFPNDAVILSILYVGFGDTAAGIVGVLFGRHKLGAHTSVEGFLAGFAACFISTMLFTAGWLPHFSLSGPPLLVFSLLAGLIGAGSEVIFKKLDDNLVIPIVSAPLVFLLMKLFV